MNIINLKQAEQLLNEGKIGVLPTDTIYGLVARAQDSDAVKRLYSVKSRENKPGTVIAASADDLIGLGVAPDVLEQAKKFWPNSVSVIVPITQEYLHLQNGSIAIRVPADISMNKLTGAVGPILTSSANLPGETPARTIAEAYNYFGSKVDFYVDGGTMNNDKPSTIVRVDEGRVEIVRQGKVIINV